MDAILYTDGSFALAIGGRCICGTYSMNKMDRDWLEYKLGPQFRFENEQLTLEQVTRHTKYPNLFYLVLRSYSED